MARRESVAVACCRSSDDAGPSDLYPDPDAAPLREALRRLGAESTLVAWDDPTAAWGSFSRVLVSSTWDSVDRPGEYLDWARSVSEVTRLINSVDVLEWNLDKVHQRELEAAGLPVIPTTWLAPGEGEGEGEGEGDGWEPPRGTEFVVKPSVSAGGRSTARYAAGDAAAIEHVSTLHARGQTVMVQDYLPAIDTDGEVDLVFFAGAFSHAVRKLPALRTGEGVVERAWERMAWSGLTTPSPEQTEVARLTMAVLSQRLAGPPTYARVDLIPGFAGEPLLLEVELIDPYLSLDLEPAGATRLAEAAVW